jgi:AraC-like DNA-binding protein
LISTVVARVARVAGIDQRRDVLAGFVEWAASDATSPEWHDDLERFIKGSTDALRRQRDETLRPCIADARIVRAMQMIESGYHDPGLSLTQVASHAGLSAWHAARLLKRLTGSGFTIILHRTRVAAAQRLLQEGGRSVKEIATVVGYSSSSQLCSHFKRLIGTTPGRYRIDQSLQEIAG